MPKTKNNILFTNNSFIGKRIREIDWRLRNLEKIRSLSRDDKTAAKKVLMEKRLECEKLVSFGFLPSDDFYTAYEYYKNFK